MACVPDVEIGEFVIVHAGVAINRVNVEEAERILNDLRHLPESDEEPRA
jgi:hydrogenase expression/formation protein HypC